MLENQFIKLYTHDSMVGCTYTSCEYYMICDVKKRFGAEGCDSSYSTFVITYPSGCLVSFCDAVVKTGPGSYGTEINLNQ